MPIERKIALNEIGVEAVRSELLHAPRPREETALILAPLDIEEEHARQFSLRENHGSASTRGIGTTNCPPHSRI